MALRLTGVGASETAAVLELSPWAGPLDVWCRKPTPRRPPLIRSSLSVEAQELGHALEPAIRRLYVERSGVAMVPGPTARHEDFPYVLSTPDGLDERGRGGLEIKLVGARMADHWGAVDDVDGVPDYVHLQCAQGMAVFNRDWWDVAALLGGTELRIYRLERDIELEAAMLESVAMFWEYNVLCDVPPDAQSHEERARYLLKRYPRGGDAGKERVLTEDPEVIAAVQARVAASDELTRLTETYDQATDKLCERVGDAYGIEGAWGSFLWYPQEGKVDWKAVAEELAGGPVKDPTLLDRHRGESTRVARYYPPSAALEKRLKKGTKGTTR
jgi:predicted phage-related endonuclease